METTETIRETRRLTRPKDGRWLGGVAAGLGAYFDLSPTIYRIAFVALSLAGGTGILLYIAAWLVIPEEGAEDSVAAVALKANRDRPSRAIGLALIAFVGVLALSSAHFGPVTGNFWFALAIGVAALVWWQVSERSAGKQAARGGPLFPLAVGGLLAAVGGIALLDLTDVWNVDWRVALAALAALTGALIAVGAATGRRVGAIVLLDLALLAALGLAVFIRVPLFAGIGDRAAHPESITALNSTYRLGIGKYTVDLADVALPAGTTHVKATLGIGNLRVHVPYGVKVVVDGHASAGQLEIFGRLSDGASVHEIVSADNGSRRVLELDARVGLGRLEVTRG